MGTIPRCRDCKGSGLCGEDGLCVRCNGMGEAELTETEKQAEVSALREQSRQLNAFFAGMLRDAGVHPDQLRRRKRKAKQ